MLPGDTTAEADEIQFRVFRAMGAERRFLAAVEMSDDVRRILADGVRHRHPDYGAEQVRLATNRLLLGDRLFREAFGDLVIDP